jgi:predicted nucleic acid-binding Zn ribbon protein
LENEIRYKKPTSGRKPEPNVLADVINRLIDTYKLRGKYNESYIISQWELLVGPAIANRTTQLYFSDKKLYIQVNSSPLRSELALAKTKFIEMLNKEIGDKVVHDIVFI